MDKSTCQSNNRGVGIFGYPGKPTIDANLLLQDVADEYGVFIGVIVQPTGLISTRAMRCIIQS